MPPLPRAAHPRGRRKEGPTYSPGRTHPALQARPLFCSFVPSCRLRAPPRAFADGVCLACRGYSRGGDLGGRGRKEGRREGREGTGSETQRDRESERAMRKMRWSMTS